MCHDNLSLAWIITFRVLAKIWIIIVKISIYL